MADLIVRFESEAVRRVLANRHRNGTVRVQLALLPIALQEVTLSNVDCGTRVKFVVAVVDGTALRVALLVNVMDRFILLVNTRRVDVSLLSSRLIEGRGLNLTAVNSVGNRRTGMGRRASRVIQVISALNEGSPFRISHGGSVHGRVLSSTNVVNGLLIITSRRAGLIVVCASIVVCRVAEGVAVVIGVLISRVRRRREIVRHCLAVSISDGTMIVVP